MQGGNLWKEGSGTLRQGDRGAHDRHGGNNCVLGVLDVVVPDGSFLS